MTWFEALTGFREAAPSQVRENLAVEGEILTSLVNKQAFAFLIGTKYDIFATLPHEEQKEITKQGKF